MNTIQKTFCSVLGVLLLFQGESCAKPDSKIKIVNRAVGSSLHLSTDYPTRNLTFAQWKFEGQTFAEYVKSNLQVVSPSLFNGRLHTNTGDLSVTIKNLQLIDSGNFSIVQEEGTKQHETKVIQLQVYDPIRDVIINILNITWHKESNFCTVHLHCLVSGHMNANFSWRGYQMGNGPDIFFNLTAEASATLNCTASNHISVGNSTKTLTCKKENESGKSGISQNILLVAGGAGIVLIIMIVGITGACNRWKTQKEIRERVAEITVYEDVHPESVTKSREESVQIGSIYETVDDVKMTPNLPETLYDKINFQRPPAVTATTSSPYQMVL